MKDKIKYAIDLLNKTVSYGKLPYKHNRGLIICEPEHITNIREELFKVNLIKAEKVNTPYYSKYVYANGWVVDIFSTYRGHQELSGRKYGAIIAVCGMEHDLLMQVLLMARFGVFIWV